MHVAQISPTRDEPRSASPSAPGPRHAAGAPIPHAVLSGQRLVAMIDDDDGARRSTARFLEGEGYRVLSFASGDAFLGAQLPEGLSCVLLDLRMRGRSGLDVLRALAEHDDAPPMIVLTGHADLSTAVEVMKLRAFDLIEKPYAPAALLKSVESASAVRERSHSAQAVARDMRRRVDRLSERQRQILTGIVRGCANKVIAWELGLSTRTVEAYRAQLFARLGVRATAGAVRIALAAGVDGGCASGWRRAA